MSFHVRIKKGSDKMDIKEKALNLHEELVGKIEVNLKKEINGLDDLALLYSPGVAAPCLEIANNEDDVYKYTMKSNTVLVVSDGSAVLGLGNIKAKAAIPVMEGKSALFKQFADLNAIPICLDTQDNEEIIRTIKNIAPVFGGINLEDFNAPRCFEIENRLKEMLDIPVFHDDQHGTAIVCLAGLINSLRLVEKDKDVKIVINGLGAAGSAITKLLVDYGFTNFSLCGRNGEFFNGRITQIDSATLIDKIQKNKRNETGKSLADALVGADVFIGVSQPDVLTKEMVKTMNDKPIVFALANPNPEINYENAKESKIAVLATGRSDYPNQINNVLVFPGLFKGALASRKAKITDEMKLIAAKALASIIKEEELTNEYIIPDAFDKRVVDVISQTIIDYKY